MITRSSRLHLSKDVPKNQKDLFSSKYLHVAPITKMVANRGVYFLESHAGSGPSLGTNQESYLDQNVIALVLLVAYALNGLVYATPKKLYPRFHLLVPHKTEHARFLIKELYIFYVPHFKQDSSLCPFLLSETASLVIYRRSVGAHTFHKNCVCTNLCKSAKKSEIKDFKSPRNEPLMLLTIGQIRLKKICIYVTLTTLST